MMKLILLCVALVLVIIHSACTSYQGNALVATPASILSLDGAQLYASNCVQCHGATPPGTWQTLTPSRIAEQIYNGGGRMPAFSSTLSAEQIAAIVQYIKQ